MHAVLQRFSDSLPNKPYCSNNLLTGVRILPRKLALTHKYIQPQIGNKLLGWMIFDVDRQGAAFAWDEANLPPPTLTIINPVNAHAHLLYQLKAPVPTTFKSNIHPIRYLGAIEHAFKSKMGADFGYAGVLTKNPLHASWRLSSNDVRYDLATLAEYVDLKHIEPRQAQGVGRNCSIFDEARKLAYRDVRNHVLKDSFYKSVLSICHLVNSYFSTPLGLREVAGIAKSISNWTWKHRDEVGGISLDAIKKIQSAAAEICSSIDVSSVCKFAQKEVARVSGLSADTIQRFLLFTAAHSK